MKEGTSPACGVAGSCRRGGNSQSPEENKGSPCRAVNASAALALHAAACTCTWALPELPAPALPAAAPQSVPAGRALRRRHRFAHRQPSSASRCHVRTRCTMGSVGQPIRTPKALAVAPGLCRNLPARAVGACHAHSTPTGMATLGAGPSPARWDGALPCTGAPRGGAETSRAGAAPSHIPDGITMVAQRGLRGGDGRGWLPKPTPQP